MTDPTPPTIGARLTLAYELHQSAPKRPPLALREIDRLCDPQLGLGHCRQIATGKIPDPGTSALRRIAGVLGCSFAWLAAGEGKAPRERAVWEAVETARARGPGRKMGRAERAAAAGEGVAK